MAEKFDQFSMQDLTALAGSSAGRQLLALLQQSDGAEVRQAMEKAAAGDLAGARERLAPLLADSQIQALVRQLGGG